MRFIASCATSAFSMIFITNITHGIETKALSGYYYDGKISGLKQRVIHYTAKGAYINVYGHRYYLRDFIRNDF